MALTTGTRLGPYEIAAKIGEGGMGEVYRARDTRLNRDVAVKVLPASFADDADRRARFEREALAVAALSHPNIVAIFDIGAHDGQVYVVMELLTGATLRERLQGGALAVRKAVDIAVQIARGLGAAHGKGIVHRDLKPENVFLLDDGQVKILDFGLARQFGGDDNNDATRTAATNPGTVLGTLGYMAPEQVRGQAVDARVDVFAFGAVLFEMVSGQRAFHGDTAADTMTAILTKEPPELSVTRADVPPSLDRIVRHCLEKNAAERFQSARDIAFALEALSGTGVSVPSSAVPVVNTPSARRSWVWPVITVASIIAASAVSVWVTRQSEPEPANVRFEPKTFDDQWITAARFGPDGETVIFSAAKSGSTPSLYVVRQGEVAQQQIGGPGTQLLSVSKTGELAVLTNAKPTWGHRVYSGTLSRMTMSGAARAWMEGVTEADWAPDGATLAVIREATGTWTLEYPAGKILFTTKTGYISDPRVSPDGKHVAFFDHGLSGDDRGWVKVVDQTGVVKTLAGEFWGEEGVAWSPDGRFVYFAAATTGAQNYQVQAVNVDGVPKPKTVLGAPVTLFGMDVAADGRMLVLSDSNRSMPMVMVPGETTERDMSWLDFSLGGFLTRDGKHMAFKDLSSSAGSEYAVAWRDTAGGPVVRIGSGNTLSVSPDGRWITAALPSNGQVIIYPTGSGEPIKVAKPTVSSGLRVATWFSDSRHLLLCGTEGQSPSRCYKVEARPGAVAEPVTPDDVVGLALGGDDSTVLLIMKDQSRRLSTVGGGPGRPVTVVRPDDAILSLSRDLKAVFVHPPGLSARVERVDLATGARTTVKQIAPPSTAGVTDISITAWREDGGYSYTVIKEISQLFVVSGVK